LRGYPANIHLWYTKNSSRKTIDIARVLGKKVRFLLAMQSMNSQVLANIKRDNIRLDVFRELAGYAREKGLMTASDLIVGLPGESLASLEDSLEQLFELGVDKVDIFNLLLIPGTDLYSQATRERFGIRTMHRLADGCVIALNGAVVAETEEVVIETDALAFDDYLTIGKYQALSTFWHHCGIGDRFTTYARRRGVPESRLFFSLLEEHR
jgi:tRNA A37 methylthiotransferase MiaB